MVLEGIIHLIGPSGSREIPAEEFFQLDGITRNVLEEGEFVLKVTFPENVSSRVGSYHKLRVRESWDFPEAGISAAWIPGDGSTLRVASTALESIPRLHLEQVAELSGEFNSNQVKSLSEAVMKSIKPVNNTTLPPRYRKAMVKVLAKRSLNQILEASE